MIVMLIVIVFVLILIIFSKHKKIKKLVEETAENYNEEIKKAVDEVIRKYNEDFNKLENDFNYKYIKQEKDITLLLEVNEKLKADRKLTYDSMQNIYLYSQLIGEKLSKKSDIDNLNIILEECKKIENINKG